MQNHAARNKKVPFWTESKSTDLVGKPLARSLPRHASYLPHDCQPAALRTRVAQHQPQATQARATAPSTQHARSTVVPYRGTGERYHLWDGGGPAADIPSLEHMVWSTRQAMWQTLNLRSEASGHVCKERRYCCRKIIGKEGPNSTHTTKQIPPPMHA